MRRGTTVLLAVVLIVAAVSAPVAAQESGPLDDLLGIAEENADENADFGLDTAQRAVSMGLQFAQGIVADALNGAADRDAATAAQDTQTFFNDHATAFEDYANARTNASTDANVLQLTFQRNGAETTVYLVADVVDGNYTNASVVDTTTRSVDETCTLSGEAAANAPDELERFYERFVKPDTDITRNYTATLAGRYRGEVDCSFMG